MKRVQPRTLREDLIPFFQNELKRCFRSGVPAEHLHPELPKSLLIDAWHLNASDIHFETRSTGARVRLRIDGVVSDVAELTHDEAKIFLNQFKALASVNPVTRFLPSDASASFAILERHIDLRIALAPSLNGETMAVRLLDAKRLERSIVELGLAPEGVRRLEDWLVSTSGMFLAAGPTGSGKTTTAYSLLHELKSANRIILSLEEPVEYQVDGVTQISIDALHNLTFADGIKAMLRHDPDFLMVGEIRDALSAQTAALAAISGRGMLSTIHCRDAVGAVTALRHWGLSNREIAESLAVVVAQRLARRLCENCRKSVPPQPGDAAWLKSMGVPVPARVPLPGNCEQCRNLGYRGRVGVFEVWRLEEEDYQAILADGDELTLKRNLARRGHDFLISDAWRKLQEGITSLEEVKRLGLNIQPLMKKAKLPARRKTARARKPS
jgi:type II secretory ATPase GspE/PulE/Tfp pilus assembly ATPase PilB-like protein